MKKTVVITICQPAPRRGAFRSNAADLIAGIEAGARLASGRPHVVLFPAGAVKGTPGPDVCDEPGFMHDAFVAAEASLAAAADAAGVEASLSGRAMPLLDELQRAGASFRTDFGGCDSSHAYLGGSGIAAGETKLACAEFAADRLTAEAEIEDGRVVRLTLLEKLNPAGAFPGDKRLGAVIASIRDYVRASGAEGAVLGLSGGIDSALVAACAVEALGAERVTALMLTSRFTSEESRRLSAGMARSLGLDVIERSIEPMHALACATYEPDVGALETGDITDQNIQARLRAMHLMAIANKRNLLLLCTANKSEAAMGYGTLYGDLAGGYCPIADLWKSEVRALARELNRIKGREVIAEEIIEREPTAELRPGQKDSDSLPPYDEIERVMTAAMSPDFRPERFSPEELEIVRKAALFAYKRKQCAAGLVLSDNPLANFDAALGINRAIEWPQC